MQQCEPRGAPAGPFFQGPWYNYEIPGGLIVMLAVLGFLFLLDIISTQMILSCGGFELNPFMSSIVAVPALHTAVKASVLILVFAASLSAERACRGSSLPFYAIIILMYGIVVIHNLIVLDPGVLPFVRL